MKSSVWVVETTLPENWSEAMVGEWCYKLVDAGLMACAHRSKTTSTYRWEGAVHSDREWLIQCKTSESKKQSLIDEIQNNHPYDLPMVIFFETQSTAEYAEWVEHN
ncbi:MAG: divalent-cation tolerance protein CutA [Candidatus Thalassarchaeaceae archaeon]